ncbi:MAG TPA: hypothetical protein PLJ43_14050, partial [Chitinophagales bacterium]|nr:hypothetical protein [Chitinophagales bacterium]
RRHPRSVFFTLSIPPLPPVRKISRAKITPIFLSQGMGYFYPYYHLDLIILLMKHKISTYEKSIS